MKYFLFCQAPISIRPLILNSGANLYDIIAKADIILLAPIGALPGTIR